MSRLRALSSAHALAALAAAAPALAAEPMSLADLAARTGKGAFEYRGSGMSYSMGGRHENVIWRFTPDGRVAGEVLQSGGGYGATQQVYRKVTGTWRRQGQQLCLQLDAMNAGFNGCYTVTSGPGGAVGLMGPVSLDGSLYGGIEPARAATPGGTVGESPEPGPRVSPRAMPGR